MAEAGRKRIDISSGTFLRALLFIALAWAWLRLWRWVLLFVIAVILAVALDPVVVWLDRRGFRRRWSAPAVMLALVLLLAGFFYLSGAELVEQAQMLGGRMQEMLQQLEARIPEGLRGMAPGSGDSGSGDYLKRFGRSLATGLLEFAVVLVVATYLLLDGRRTYAWLVAFAPRSKRERVHRTGLEAREAMLDYMRGNVTTSVLATIATYVVLLLLKVPAALLMAILTGILNFVPIVGLILSIVPAVLLALTVSPTAAIIVAGFYLGYNAFENYFIQPRVYGRQMQLSSLVVLGSLTVGAELAGVLGALIALPVAAMYPPIESLWLKGTLHPEAVEDHRRIEQTEEH